MFPVNPDASGHHTKISYALGSHVVTFFSKIWEFWPPQQNLCLKGSYHDQLSFYLLKHSFCWAQRHICWLNLIFDSPTIKQKLKFLVLVRHVKLAIRNNKWHTKLAIRNNKWHTKLAIRKNTLSSLFCMPLISWYCLFLSDCYYSFELKCVQPLSVFESQL